jgi:hypothetical protein
MIDLKIAESSFYHSLRMLEEDEILLMDFLSMFFSFLFQKIVVDTVEAAQCDL